MKYFGTDGIRGQVNSKNINGDMFFKFGLAAGKYFTNLKKNKQTAIIAKMLVLTVPPTLDILSFFPDSSLIYLFLENPSNIGNPKEW